MSEAAAKTCPICGRDNNCGNLAGKPNGTCWCSDEFFPKEIFAFIPPEQLGISCICKACLKRFMDNHGSTPNDPG